MGIQWEFFVLLVPALTFQEVQVQYYHEIEKEDIETYGMNRVPITTYLERQKKQNKRTP